MTYRTDHEFTLNWMGQPVKVLLEAYWDVMYGEWDLDSYNIVDISDARTGATVVECGELADMVADHVNDEELDVFEGEVVA